MLSIMRRQFQRNGMFLMVVMLVLAGFEVLLCAMVSSMDVESAFNQMSALAPALVRAIIEQNMPGGSAAAVLAFGWNHPVAHALLTAVAIALPARAIAGEIENGTIEIVLAQPISRARYFAAHVLFGAAAISAVLAAGLLGTAIGQQAFSVNAFVWERLAALFLNMFVLQFALYALTLVASAFGREAGRVALVGVLIAVISFLVNAIAMLWSKALFAKPVSLHAYYEPREILTQGQWPVSSVLLLTAVAAVALAMAFARFSRRDLP